MLKLKNILVMLFAAVIMAGSANAQTLLWSEEFDGTSINTSKWVILDEADGSDAWYRPENLEVSGGTLKIYNKEELYNGDHWTGGHIDALYYPQYKYLESRVRHSVADAFIWSAWWTVGWIDNDWKWPPEFDTYEFQGGPDPESPGSWYHWDYGGSGHLWAGDESGLDETQWHTYGVYWSPDEACTFYIDGVISSAPVGPAEGALMGAKLKLTSSPSNRTRVPGCLLATMEVDYVRVYDVPPTQSGTQHLALNKPVTGSSAKNSGGAIKRTNDISPVTRWESNWYDPQWLTVDLQAICSVNQVKLLWQYSAGKNYNIQIANAPYGPWTDCITITGNDTSDSYLTHNFSAKTGRYLRLYGTARKTPYGYSLKDMQVFGSVIDSNPTDPPVRENLASGRNAVASSQQAEYEGETFGPTNITDGSDTTRWASSWSDPEWVYVDLGSVTAVDTVVINWQSACAKEYKVQVANSSGGPWTDCATAVDGTYGLKIHEFASIDARYVRMYGTVRRTGYGYSIYEMEVYGGEGGGTTTTTTTSATTTTTAATTTTTAATTTTTAATTTTTTAAGGNLALNKSASASTTQSDNIASNANDGDAGTRWTASDGTYSQWWKVDLGASYDLSRVDIDWYGSDRSYKYRIETSNNDSTYTTRVDQTDRTATGDSSDSFEANARYVRITVTGSSSGWASMYEVEVYGGGGTTTTTAATTTTTAATTTTTAATTTTTAATTTTTAATTTTTAAGGVLTSANFESGFGEWVNVTGDSDDWTRDSGGTPSGGTGPSSGANGSTWYVFLETSSGYANSSGDTAYLESPDIGGSDRTLTFYYHMYGNDIGTLNVDVYSGGSWTNGVWSISSEQHSSSEAAYTQATVGLGAYSGTIAIRFRGVADGGYQGDMAIDDIEVTGGGTTTTTTSATTTTTAAGGNLALNKPAVSSSNENSSRLPEMAVDGDEDTRWASESSDPQWIYVDLGATYSINQVKLLWEFARGEEYKIQVASSSSGPWTDCIHITDNTTYDTWLTHNFSTQSGRYVRMYGIQRATGYGYSLWEMEVYGP